MHTRELDEIIGKYDLNRHPFYRAWRAGTLPRSALAAYAGEYEPFILSIELGWSALGNDVHAADERRHAQLWGRFRDELGTPVATPSCSPSCSPSPSCPEAQSLVAEARRAFADKAEAIGALYAFEAQQPSTAATKLEGLNQHYALSPNACAYFRLHAGDYGERDELAAHAAELDETESRRALVACELLSRAMWYALDGLLRDHAAGHR